MGLMKLYAPTVNIDEEASNRLVESTINSLVGKNDPFVILSKEEMSYIQSLWTDNGFIVSFQNGGIDEHYEFNTYISRPQTIKLFQAYLANTDSWQGNFEYSKKSIGGFWYKLGEGLGRFFGNLVKGFNEAKNKRRN